MMDSPEPPTLEAARMRAADGLADLAAAERWLAECRRRGDGWSVWQAMQAVDRAGHAYVQADSWLVRCLLRTAFGKVD